MKSEYEKTRKLDNQPLTGAGNLTIRLGLDYEAIKYMDFSLTGAIQTTFVSGTPVSRQEGPLHQLIPVIRVLRESDAFKAVSPHFLRMQQLYSQQAEGARRGSAAAAAATNNETTVDVKAFPYGTTTQYTTTQDSVRMFFHPAWLKQEWEQRKSWFKTIGLSSASVEFQQNSYAKLLSAANTAPVAFANSTLQIETVVTEQKDLDARPSCVVQFKETLKSDPVAAAGTDRRISINQGNALAAIHLYCLDGAAGSATTATDALPTNQLISNLRLVANADRYLKSTTFKRLKDENKSRYGVVAAMASNVANDDGYAVLNFVHNNLNELIDTRKGVVDSLDLVYDVQSGASFTNGANVFIKIDEITNLPK